MTHPVTHTDTNSHETLDESVQALETLTSSLLDNQASLRKVGEESKNALLKEIFLAESLERARYRGAIETILHQEGVHDIEESTTVGGSLRRTWAEVKSVLGGGDRTLLATAGQAEAALMKDYAKALDTPQPLPIRQLIVSQYVEVQSNADFIKAARESGEIF
jgi:uncharacterized protein (TIGR02284 family)